MKPRNIYLMIAILMAINIDAVSQPGYFVSGIFSNKVLFNPSQAGIRGAANINMIFKTAMDNSQSGLARELVVNGDVPVSQSAGVGFVLQNQTAGLLRHTLFNFCYAYGIKFREDFKLRFGIGAGFKNVRALTNNSSLETVIGDPNDPALTAYNSIPPSFYNVFSVSANMKNIELQLVAPNLTAALQNKNFQGVDYLQLQGGLSYVKQIGGGNLLNEESSLRVFGGAMMYKQSGTLAMGGIELNANGYLTTNVMYNSSGVMTGGLGVILDKSVQIGLNYSIGGLYSRNIYGGAGVAELHIGYLFKKKN